MAEGRRHAQVVNTGELEGKTSATGTKFGATQKPLGLATGAKGIGCTWYEVPPGRAAFPHHFHCINEESMYVLEGEGTLRIGPDSVAVRAGDYMTFPAGPETAHQLRNTGTAPLRYLCLSTKSTAEVVGYPDSGKVAAAASPSLEAALKGHSWVRVITMAKTDVGYYDGEDVG
jgi:uncharacterized cupin superfamily protein